MSEEEEGGGTFIDTSGARSSSTTNTPPPPPTKEKRRDGAYIIIIIMLLLAGGFLGWKLSEKNEIINTCQNERDELQIEIEGLNTMMYDQGLEVGEDVKENLQNMLTMYDKMKVENTDMADSINAQKDRIKTLMSELEDAKGDKAAYASKVYKLQKETDVLRSIMKDYIRTIDSLNVANGVLTESLAETMENLDKTQSSLNNMTEERDQLSDKVNKGSKLVAFGFTTTGIKEKGSGSYKEMTRASGCTHIRSCFTVGDNAIASPGDKTIYMRIITPSGTVLNSSQSNTLKTEGGQSLLYSDKKVINYQNQATDLCVFYKLTEEIAKGNYSAQIYADGVLIGSDNFVLK
ncbi:MAG: hypothetical protein R2780_05415 [Crocinitomicaceae bacterium]|nr:hypothetical protein [Crocinitomicaceae bacterium]